MLKAAVIGCGGIGKAHARALTAIDGVELAAVVDLNAQAAEAAGAEFGAVALTGVDQLPDDIDMATVATPPMHHYEPVKALLERGTPVLSEKPITMDVGQARELAALSESAGVPLLLGFKMRFEPIFARARELVKEVGPLRAIVSTKMQPYHEHAGLNWFPRVGAMYELSIHDFDLIRFVTGLDPERVRASLTVPDGWTREKAFTIEVEYAEGVRGSHTGLYTDASKFMYRDFVAQFVGERGYLLVQRPDRLSLHTDSFTVEEVDPDGPNAFECEMANLRDVVLGAAPPATTAHDGLIGTALVEAAFASGTGAGGWEVISDQ